MGRARLERRRARSGLESIRRPGALLAQRSGGRQGSAEGDMDINEDELLVAIRRVLSSTDPGVIVAVGDDAAVVRPGVGDLVLTTDALVEGTHFERATSTAHDVGSKAIA